MKIRQGYVSNSSSTSFYIRNNSNKDLTLVDFVKENPQLIEDFIEQYDWSDTVYTQEGLLISAQDNNEVFPANSEEVYIFGDEDGTIIGRVFDYILRDGGESENFEWWFKEYLR